MSHETTNLFIGWTVLLVILAEGLVRIPGHMFEKLPVNLRRVFAGLVVTCVVVSMASQGIQYVQASVLSQQASDATKEARRLEREFTNNLYLFAENDPVQTDKFLSTNPYLAGYREYRNRHYQQAEAYFKEAIDKSQFVAESHYLLAYIALLEHEKAKDGDFEPVKTEIKAAMEADPDYGQPYYLRAIVEVKEGNGGAALDDIEKSARLQSDTRYDIHQPKEIALWWQGIAKEPRLKKIQTECQAHWNSMSHI